MTNQLNLNKPGMSVRSHAHAGYSVNSIEAFEQKLGDYLSQKPCGQLTEECFKSVLNNTLNTCMGNVFCNQSTWQGYANEALAHWEDYA